jgi:hypothetical protein
LISCITDVSTNMLGLGTRDILSPLQDLVDDRWCVVEALWHRLPENLVLVIFVAIQELGSEGIPPIAIFDLRANAVPNPKIK